MVNKIPHKITYWAIILVVQFLLFYILSKTDFAVAFFSRLFEWKKNLHILLFSKFGFSAGDILYAVISLYSIYALISLIRKKKSKIGVQLLIFINFSFFVYQCFWGMLYFQPPMIEKLPKKEISDIQLKNLALRYLDLCKATRERTSEDQNGIFVINDPRAICTEILLQQKKLPRALSDKSPVEHLSVKPSLYSGLMDYSGLLGYYNPFTAEAQYNPHLPSTQLPFTLAHEMSHQLGYAREQEASFVAYLCAKDSDNVELKYCAQLYVLKSLLRNLSENNKAFVKDILSKYSAKMKRDRANELQFFEKHDSFLNTVFGFTNDLFLKSNRQDGSITYSYFIALLVRYEA
ncbi:DUF3810 domain-containing protein [Chryseobacterium sp. SC28]|uniref:DUF3810 domain-containing protein n=1 Tax=Chryseobacterium sp. SC28 TaxID=2268028 RepID=UPI000F65036F|nr:DUF3810 domain-containing protein [Chryseobacterium sp. SC28]RRQ46573.1 DUF3810 domain-containing protein [Chryseobacterium sp. SC28]